MSAHFSFRHIRRSPYQTISAILIMVITFFMVTMCVLIGFITSAVLKHFETKPQISAFYPNDTPESEILDIKKKLEKSGLTKKVVYISSKDAVEKFKRETKNEIDSTLDILSDKILPPSLEITAWKIADLRTLREEVEKKEGVNVIYVEEIINRLDKWLSGIRLGGMILLILLGVESILVIWTIIAMRISQRKQEIEIMRLLGATNWYVRAPFILEGMLYGIIGAIIGSAITLVIFNTIAPDIKDFLSGIPVLPLTPHNFITIVTNNVAQESLDGVPLFPVTAMFIAMFVSAQVMLGMLIGAVGSYIAVLRNLKSVNV